MDCVKEYEALPFEIQSLIEQYSTNLDFAEDCLDTLLGIRPENEGSIRALAESYAEWKHGQLNAYENLKGHGLSEQQIDVASMGYYMKYKNK